MVQTDTQFNLEEFEFAYPRGIENHYWTRSRNAILIRAIKSANLENDLILDVGCGKGIVVAAMREQKINCWGVEIAKVAPVEPAAEFVKSGVDANALEEKFRKDVRVLMFLDVLEHIQDPGIFLKATLTHFPAAKHVIITLPARQEIWSNYDEHYRHYLRYTLDKTEQLVLSSGLEVITNRYLFHLLYWITRFVFLFSRKRPVKINPPLGLNKLIHRILSLFLFLDDRILPGTLPGTSLICIAVKRN